MGFLGFGKGKSVNAETQGDDTGTEASSQVTTNEGVEDGEGGLLSKFFTFGSQQPFEATDYSDTYAKAKGYFLRFKHIQSGLTLSFKGFITNLQDDFTSNWKNQSVYGRMDEIYTFQNTTRRMSVSFVVPAFNAADARCNLTKVTKLARKLYPYYSDGAGNNATSISKAPLMRVEFANLIRDGRFDKPAGLLGKVNGFSITPNIDHGFFDEVNHLYPKTIEISFTFDVLHEHIMGWTDGANKEVTGTNLLWSEGKANAFPYARALTNDPTSAEPVETPTDEDAEADNEENLGFWKGVLFSG